MTIGFPRESGTERRSILLPALARQLTSAGFAVIAEQGIGTGVFIDDDDYAAAGVRLAGPDEAWAVPLVLRYKSPDPRRICAAFSWASTLERCFTQKAIPTS